MKVIKSRDQSKKDRKKDPKIVQESQKVFSTLKRWGYITLGMLLLVGVGRWIYDWYHDRDRIKAVAMEEDQKQAIARALPAPIKSAPQKTVKRIVAPPDDKEGKQFSEWVEIPPYHSFVLECNAHVWMVPNHRLIDCGPVSIGRDLPNRFRFQSASEKEVTVTVSYWPERK